MKGDKLFPYLIGEELHNAHANESTPGSTNGQGGNEDPTGDTQPVCPHAQQKEHDDECNQWNNAI